MTSLNYQWISQPQQLDVIVQDIAASELVAIDTEFIRVETLHPILGVLQINANGNSYVIDGQMDLMPIWNALFAAKMCVFHACGEDIELIYQYSQQKPLKNVFDTQVALAFLNYGNQLSYQNALNELLDIHVEKDQTRSDWLARPLQQKQLAYAAADVFYLIDLAEVLISKLKEKQLYDYVLEDCRSLSLQLGNETSPEEAYLHTAHAKHRRHELMQLKQICEWREHLAIELNKPRNYILKNNVIHKLIEDRPKNVKQLSRYRDIRSQIVWSYGEKILSLINDLPAKSFWPERLPTTYCYHQQDNRYDVEDLIYDFADDLDIPDSLLMRKKWHVQVADFVVNGQCDFDDLVQTREKLAQLNPYLSGWRFEPIILPMMKIIAEDMNMPTDYPTSEKHDDE